MADEISRKIERLELVQKYLSILISIASFWIITLFWNYYNFGNLALVPRLGLAAALSWDVFLHAEAIGMLIMTMMKEKWQAEAQDARKEAREAQAREAEARLRAQGEAQMAKLHAQALEAQLQLQEREAQLQAREADLRMREAQLREAQLQEAQAREAEAREREAQAQETIRELRRRLEAAENGEDANGANA